MQRNEAERIVQRAYSFANRKLFYSARREFLRALRLLAQAKDATTGTRTHSNSLTAGLRAIDEADDFRPRGTRIEAEMDLTTIVSSHRTPLLRDGLAERASPLAAIEEYHAFAAEQLGVAVAGEPVGSMALYGLAKIVDRLSQQDGEHELESGEKAVTLYRAALFAHPQNHLAANEAGVMLARHRRLREATAMLHRALQLAPSPVSYHNLAMVQQQQGLSRQAAANEAHARRIARQQTAPADCADSRRGVGRPGDVRPRRNASASGGVATSSVAAPQSITAQSEKNLTTNCTNEHESGLYFLLKREPSWAPELGR